MSFAIGVAGVAGAACSDAEDPACIEGVCPDWDETRSLPGPCRAGVQESFAQRFDFAYDAAGRVTSAGYVAHNEEEGRDFFYGAKWSYDADGSPLQILRYVPDPLFNPGVFTWTFDAQEVRVTKGGLIFRYDRAMFAFMPLIGINLMAPSASLGLVQDYRASYEWTVDGTRRIQRELPGGAGGGPLSTSTYELDARGRIISITRDEESDGLVDSREELVYDGDLLLRWGDMEWSYDLGGNVVEGHVPYTDHREVYAYDCW